MTVAWMELGAPPRPGYPGIIAASNRQSKQIEFRRGSSPRPSHRLPAANKRREGMNPDYLVGGGVLALALSGLLHSDGLTQDQRERMRLEYEGEQRALAIERRATSPAVAAAETKRARKAEKLRRISP